MNIECSPILVSLKLADDVPSVVNMMMTKAFVASLMRSLFTGKIKVFSAEGLPLYKIERKSLSEVFLGDSAGGRSNMQSIEIPLEFIMNLLGLVEPMSPQWVVVANSKSLALRNIDHLIPLNSKGPFSSPEVDFYWARAGADDLSNLAATPGVWAVRGEHLPIVLERWKAAGSEEQLANGSSEEEIWTRVVHELPLRKRAFEKGEVVAPRIGAVDWEAVSNAAFVTVPDWPEKEAWKFLQALYFGTYLGDETGMMLNILEA